MSQRRKITAVFKPATNGLSQLALSAVVLHCACFLSLESPAQADSPTWKSFYDLGNEALAHQNPAESEQNFRKALSLADKESKTSEDTQRCLMKLADTLTLRNETAEAQGLYRRLLTLEQSKYGSNSKQIVPVLMALGSIQEGLGNHGEAIGYYQRALSINERNYGPYSPAFAENLHALGRTNAKRGKRQVAVKQYKQAISILMKDPSLGASERLQGVMRDYSDLIKNSDDDSDKSLIKDFDKDVLRDGKPPASKIDEKSSPISNTERAAAQAPVPGATSTIRDHEAYASTNSGSGQNGVPGSVTSSPSASSSMLGEDSAKPGDQSAWQKQALDQKQSSNRSQINEDPQVALRAMKQPWSDSTLSPAYSVVNESIIQQGRYDKGEPYYERMIAVDLDALGPHHPSVANDLSGLANLYMRQQKYEKAEPLLVRAKQIYQDSYGSDNLLTINACASLALAKSHLGQSDQAADLYKTALSRSQATLGPNNLETARILNELAYLYYHQGKLQESRTFYAWAAASTEAAVGQKSPMLAACLKDYANVLRSLGQNNDATSLETRADGILDINK